MWIKICNFAICWLVWKNWSTKILAYNPVLVRLRSQIKKRKIKVLHKVGSLRSWNYNTAVKDYVDIVCGKTVRSANLKVRFVEKMWKWVPVATISRILLLSLFSFIKTYNPIEFLSGSVCWIIFTKNHTPNWDIHIFQFLCKLKAFEQEAFLFRNLNFNGFLLS